MSNKLYYIVRDNQKNSPYVRFEYYTGSSKSFHPTNQRAKFWVRESTAKKKKEALENKGYTGLSIGEFEPGK